jgi:hypothetical protein
MFTMRNMKGFEEEELQTLNAVLARMLAEGLDEDLAKDRILEAWFKAEAGVKGISEDELYEKAQKCGCGEAN